MENLLTRSPIEPIKFMAEFLVKREDLACIKPGPPFAKIRGLLPYLEKLKSEGIETVGYMDTAISMAGWGISFICKHLKMKAVIYYPEYKDGYRYNQSRFIPKWKHFGAIAVPLENPTQRQINIHRATRIFKQQYPKGHFLPDGLRLPETRDNVALETITTFNGLETPPKTLVCNVGSGVMLSGVLKGLYDGGFRVEEIYGVLTDKRADTTKKARTVLEWGGFDNSFKPKLLSTLPNINEVCNTFALVQTTYNYTETPDIEAPFPCNPWYDLKAYEWMIENAPRLQKPVLFWNIGA